eukprot:COSAG02_NODE_14148_length_1304_cov_3.160166_1_plen_64_part_00
MSLCQLKLPGYATKIAEGWGQIFKVQIYNRRCSKLPNPKITFFRVRWWKAFNPESACVWYASL